MTNNTPSVEKFNSLSLALEYLDRHFGTRYIFPIKATRKNPPLVKDNLDGNASNDPAKIRDWAKRFPGCNWGVAHRKSKLLVVDVDCNVAKGKRGQETYDALALAYDWAETEKTVTPSGGFHLIYQGWSDDRHDAHIMALGENGLGTDIDSPNYTLIPGCTFEDGTSYVGNGADAVRCPEWIYDVILTAKQRKRGVGADAAGELVVELDQQANVASAITFLQEDAEPAIEGKSGDGCTFRAAAYLKDLGISVQRGAELMNEYYNPRCEPPWDLDDLVKKMESAYSYGKLSKVGGKTAEADFADDPIEPFEPMGDPVKIAADAKLRKDAAENARKDRQWKMSEVIKEWVYLTDKELWVNRELPPADALDRNYHMLKCSAFDKKFAYLATGKGPKSMTERLLWARRSVERFRDFVYKPGRASVYSNGGHRYLNLYVPSGIEPSPGNTDAERAEAARALELFNDHLTYLFPDAGSRNHVLNWMAWLLQNLEEKPRHALLIQGNDQGTGKSWIADLLRTILNSYNVADVTEEMLSERFNEYERNSKLIVIEELRSVDKNGVMLKLHPMITQVPREINVKNQPRNRMDTCYGVFAMTNMAAALVLDPTDRRYLIVRTDAKPRYGKDTPESRRYYRDLYRLLKSRVAVAAIFDALLERDVGDYDGLAAAPYTSAKGDMIDAGGNDLVQWMREHDGEAPFNLRVVTVKQIAAALPRHMQARLTTDSIKAAIVRRGGLSWPVQIKPTGGRDGAQQLRVWVQNDLAATVKAGGWLTTNTEGKLVPVVGATAKVTAAYVAGLKSIADTEEAVAEEDDFPAG
ncbi:bifunctional DNA primase/polymerase [Bradyrhizobium sp. 41S5]|uniref:bifunctional DNA primase/polymerase n=1 Tax=Bradyrhizobium sp. 41S5 TaxID=1404443 RepID=UPI00156AF5D1|nr:bifunctional DNA primase/polymerase [Bradyrhizobium sp. 41S5]UFX45224.1 bifunctional DNA primase/polymerase [Bradyrhizobium sp. 41S5]